MSDSYIDKKSVKEIGAALFQLRCQKNLFLYQVARQTNMPAKVIEGMEIGRYLKFGKLRPNDNIFANPVREPQKREESDEKEEQTKKETKSNKN